MSEDIERRLQEAFRGGSLPPAPASLVDALHRVPEASVRSRRSRSLRTGFGLLAAAALIATLGALAITGGSFRQPGPVTPTIAPSPSPATDAGLRLEYEVLPADGVVPDPSDLATIVSIVEARIATTGAADATVQAEGSDRIIVTLPGITDPEPIRTFIGQIGQVDFVPLGQTQVAAGQTLDLSRFPPLFGGDAIASASVGADQNGQPAIDFVLDPEGTRLFADYTAQNIGSSFAITVDGAVLTAPVIQNAIPGGDVQITGGGVDGFDANEAARMVAILQSGPLPFPIHEVGP